jgi:hypothetical protein
MPRTITNNANLPGPIYRALSNDTYVGGGDISVTRVIAPPRIVALKKYHEDEIVEDASDRIWSVLGQAGHKVLELSAGGDEVAETRLYMPFQGIHTPDGPMMWKLSGQPDLYNKKDKVIYDYKYTSVWSVLFGDKPEWEKQVNMQAMLHRYKEDRVESAFIVAIMRDWQTRKARYEKNYPPTQIKIIGIPLWPQGEVIDYTERRIKLHQRAQLEYIKSNKNPDSLPLCTPDERWYRGHGYAIKKKNTKTGVINKKADRVFDNMTDAKQYMWDNAATLPKGKEWADIEERPGENIRCMTYCDVAAFCPFGRALHEAEKAKHAQAALVSETTEED